jgi:DUF971 family protein
MKANIGKHKVSKVRRFINNTDMYRTGIFDWHYLMFLLESSEVIITENVSGEGYIL